MSKPKEGLIKADIGDIFESMESSFYWIQESLQRFQRQLESKPSLLEEFKQLESQPLDLIGKLKGIETEIVEFMRVLEKTISSNRLEKTRLGLRVNSGYLKKKELAQLHHMNI